MILDLILALQSQPAARTIRSRTENGPLSGDIAAFYARLSSNQENAKHVAPLLKLVVTQKSGVTQTSDADIWAIVLDLIARTRPIPQPTTPPQSHPSFTSSFQQTPWSFNTGSFTDTSEHRNQVDDALKEELLPSLRIDVPDFVHAVFGLVPGLDKLAEKVFDICQEGDAPLYTIGSGWAKWPLSATEELVLEWLQGLTTRFAAWTTEHGERFAAGRQIYQGPSVYLDGSAVKRKMDVGITARHGQSKGEDGVEERSNTPISNWGEILVTGELKSNPVQDGQAPGWLDLATYAREVFRSQDRRFVLGFTLCGSIMRLWHFDRSGSSGSSSFDINEDGFRFIHVMLGYFLMNDKQLGLDPTIQQSDGKRYMEVTRNGEIERLILTQLIKKQAVIAGRATTCWKAYRDGDESRESLNVKDSWQYEERPEEGGLIKEATDKGVRNIARYYHHETVQIDGKNDDTIENVRRALMKICGRTTFKQKSFIGPELPSSESLGRAVVGRAPSGSLSRKRSSSSAQMARSPNKRSCSSRRSRDPATPAHNRIRRRVITLDTGKTIQKARSLKAVLNGLIGAINGRQRILSTKNLANVL